MRKDDFGWLAPIYDVFIKPRENPPWESALPVAGLFLEVGGGTARTAMQIVSDSRKVILADLSFPMLKVSKKYKEENLMQVCCDAHYLPFPDACFDGIFVVDALHHIQNAEIVPASLIGKIRPGGSGIIEEPNIRHWQIKLIAIMERLLMMDSHFYTEDQIVSWLNGDEITTEVQYFDLNFAILIKNIDPK